MYEIAIALIVAVSLGLLLLTAAIYMRIIYLYVTDKKSEYVHPSKDAPITDFYETRV